MLQAGRCRCFPISGGALPDRGHGPCPRHPGPPAGRGGRSSGSVPGHLYTILRNCCWKLAARRGKQEASALETIEILSSTGGGTVEDRLALEEALGCLSPQSREILMLRHLDGLSYEELAARLELPAGTVMSRLFYSRKELREQLGGKR